MNQSPYFHINNSKLGFSMLLIPFGPHCIIPYNKARSFYANRYGKMFFKLSFAANIFEVEIKITFLSRRFQQAVWEFRRKTERFYRHNEFFDYSELIP